MHFVAAADFLVLLLSVCVKWPLWSHFGDGVAKEKANGGEGDGRFVNPALTVVAFIVVPFASCNFSVLPLQANVSSKEEWRTVKNKQTQKQIERKLETLSGGAGSSHKELKVLPSVPASYTHTQAHERTRERRRKREGEKERCTCVFVGLVS